MTPTASATAKGLRTRERILQTAADLFHERGINATTAGDVLRASATGKGQFYQHFPSREALVNEVLKRHRAFPAAALPIRSWDDLRAEQRAGACGPAPSPDAWPTSPSPPSRARCCSGCWTAVPDRPGPRSRRPTPIWWASAPRSVTMPDPDARLASARPGGVTAR
jgi:AcrR family transcriptional regulator